MVAPKPFDSAFGSAPQPVVTFSPVVLPVPGRQVDLQMKVSAPARGSNLPIILFSHGHGRSNFLSSLHGYGPLVDFYAAHGFVVIQPTHQSSKTLNLDPKGPEGALFWRSRATDMHFILDHLDQIEATVPGLAGRLDRSRIAAVGHSMGGHTVAMLAGMRVTDPHDGQQANLAEPRIKAAVLVGAPGKGNFQCSRSAKKEHSAGTWSRSAIWPRPTVHLCKMVGGDRPWGDIARPDLVAPKRPLGLARRRAVTLDEAMTYALAGLEAA